MFLFYTKKTEREILKMESTEKIFEYKENKNGITITKYNENDTDVKIPQKINGKTVTEIGEYAFAGCKGLKKIIIPNNIMNIGFSVNKQKS